MRKLSGILVATVGFLGPMACGGQPTDVDSMVVGIVYGIAERNGEPVTDGWVEVDFFEDGVCSPDEPTVMGGSELDQGGRFRAVIGMLGGGSVEACLIVRGIALDLEAADTTVVSDRFLTLLPESGMERDSVEVRLDFQ